jgi:hypothetical protein
MEEQEVPPQTAWHLLDLTEEYPSTADFNIVRVVAQQTKPKAKLKSKIAEKWANWHHSKICQKLSVNPGQMEDGVAIQANGYNMVGGNR